jgi:periplasmic divalent cation tolerance protein
LDKNFILILVATKDKQEAENITKALLNERLIACGNISGPVTSFFHWSGQIEKSEECLVVMKSRMDLFAQVAERVKGLHSYEVPEILALPIVDGSQTYLDWMNTVLQ